ncbi:FHA domain-containing protein [bacterium]|nr:FHA domain-containing protein [bacterium]
MREPTTDEAYLVVKTGPLEGREYKLSSGQIATIGRAPTNRIAVPDEVCSRNHCEVFYSGGRWVIRDLDSRNGTRVQGEFIEKDHILTPGEQIQLGSTVLWYTLDPTPPTPEPGGRNPLDADTASELRLDGQQPEILHRTRDSRFRTAEKDTRDRLGRDLARLYKLAIEMGAAPDISGLAEAVLEGLLTGTVADLGAVLIFDGAGNRTPNSEQLRVIAYKSRHGTKYERVSDSLSRLAIDERDAILARDVTGDVRLKSESVHEISAQSVICAPLRVREMLLGLIHLYSTDLDNSLEPEHLDFTLAVADQFALALEKLHQREELAVGLARAEIENRTLREQLRVETELIGNSPSIQKLRDRIARIAPTDATVLIRGESGVGKELVARALHTNSSRRHGPFVTMNCAALSETLLESELFGHERGAFTGAVNRKIGKFEQADRGTIFLDEVGEMSPAIQAKFLRVLEGHKFERVGGAAAVQVDVRVVAATNRELEQAVEDGVFRKDLYFRLQVVELTVEPLRMRHDDVALLARFFLERFARKIGRPIRDFTPQAVQMLTAYDWPGNVRELQNTIERAVILAHETLVDAEDIQLSALGARRLDAPLDVEVKKPFRPVPLDIVEREHILAVLDWTQGNKSQAAQTLGIERSTLDRKLKRYDVERKREG